MKTFLIVFTLLMSITLTATIINIPTDYATIQSAINSAQDADTLLVQSGTYVENINYNGKNITIASLFLTTQDSVYISETIIDGNEAGSVVIFETNESNSAVLMGFTLTNGSATKGGGVHCNQSNPTLNYLKIVNNYSLGYGGGISCENSNPVILNSMISDNTAEFNSGGGGIYCHTSEPSLTNVQISNNSALSGHGGGFCCSHNSNPSLNNVTLDGNFASSAGGGFYAIYQSSPILVNVIISNNSTYYKGGGLHSQYDSHPTLEHVLITGNTSNDRAGGISCSGTITMSDVTIHNNSAVEGGGIYFEGVGSYSFDVEERCNIYSNFATLGNDLYSGFNSVVEVVVDTFTVQNPNNMQAYPIEHFSFDILHAYYPEVNGDIYVSPTGDDQNSGLSWDEPLKTIHTALTRIQTSQANPKSIYLSSGLFSFETNNEFFPLTISSNISLIGAGQNETIISGTGNDNILSLSAMENIIIRDITVSNGTRAIFMEDCSNITLESLNLSENFIDDYLGLGGGVFSSYCDSLLFNDLTVYNNNAKYGAGLYLEYVNNSQINNCVIKSNNASSCGGGIAIRAGSVELNNLKIFDNRGTVGGGLSCLQQALVSIDSVSIYNNRAGSGGGIYCQNEGTTLSFAANNSCSVYLNSAGRGNDISLYSIETIEVIVDTFTVFAPTNFHTYPKENFNLDILHSVHIQENSDLYVSPTGDDNYSGLTSSEPLKTIHIALSKVVSDSLNPHTIYLDEGIYSAETNGECYPLSLAEDCLTLQGNETNSSILDGSSNSTLITSYLSNDCKINDLILQNGFSFNGSGIISSWDSELYLSNITGRNNSSTEGGNAFTASNSNIIINRACLINNDLGNGGDILCFYNSSIKLLNSTIVDNNSGKAIYHLGGRIAIVNSVIRNESTYQLEVDAANAIISHSNLAGGEAGIHILYEGEINWLEGNIDADPLFGESYYLPLNSPCVDTGTDYFEWDNEIILELEAEEYYGSAPDMGAYEFGFVGIDDNEEIPNSKLSLGQNYPNPFNPSGAGRSPTTRIDFSLPIQAEVELTIYNTKGQKVRTLAHNEYSKGNHSFSWNGEDNSDKSVSSGIYYYKLKVNGNTEAVKKCLLLK